MLFASPCFRKTFRFKGKTINLFSLSRNPCFPATIQKEHLVSNVFFGLNPGENMRHGGKHFLHTNHISTIPIGVSSFWPLFASFGKSFGICQSLTTQASSDEEEVTNEVLDEILSAIEKDPSSSREIGTSYITKLCRAGNLMTAAKLLQFLRDNKIYLSPNAYNLVLLAAGEHNNLDLLSQAFKDLIVCSDTLSSTSYHNLVKAFMKSNDNVLLLKFVREISELTVRRNAVVNRMIYAFAECGQIDRALLIFDNMKSLKYKPDVITYNTILVILGRAGRVDEMLQEFAFMKEANVVPDIVSYNTLINSLRRLGRLDLCLVLLREMPERGLDPDLRTYTALIEGFGRSGNIEESLKLFEEMKQRHIRPSIYIYRSLINNLKKMGKLELAMTITEELHSCPSDLVGPNDFKRKNR